MKKLRILQVGKYFYPEVGGMENHLYSLCNQLKKKIDWTILVFNTKNKDQYDLVNELNVIRAARFIKLFSTPISFSLISKMKKFNGDIIHLHLPNPFAVLAYLIARPKGKLIVTYHYDVVKQRKLMFIYEPFLNIILKRAEKIIVTAKNNYINSPILIKYFSKCVVIPLGIDPNEFKLTLTVKEEVKKIQKRYGNKIALFVGRLTYYKGLEYLINAVKNENFNLLIIGSGEEKLKLKELASQVKNIFFLNKVNNLLPYYYACDMFVLPSIERSEAFGIVQLEAMICGKPVICTNLKTGVPEVQKNNVTGIVVEAKNSYAIKHAIIDLFSNSPKKNKMGRAARKRVIQKFTNKRNALAHQRLYEALK